MNFVIHNNIHSQDTSIFLCSSPAPLPTVQHKVDHVIPTHAMDCIRRGTQSLENPNLSKCKGMHAYPLLQRETLPLPSKATHYTNILEKRPETKAVSLITRHTETMENCINGSQQSHCRIQLLRAQHSTGHIQNNQKLDANFIIPLSLNLKQECSIVSPPHLLHS